jgi:hypothetical protein
MMRINGVCEYTETCNYEANKIHIRFKASKRIKKGANMAHPILSHYMALL